MNNGEAIHILLMLGTVLFIAIVGYNYTTEIEVNKNRFKYEERVVVAGGFYSGQSGIIVKRGRYGSEYMIRTDKDEIIWIDTELLEKE